MKIKVQTFFFTRFLCVLALLMGVAGHYSFAQTTFTKPFKAPVHVSINEVEEGPEEGIPGEVIAPASDSLLYEVNEITADTSDTVQVQREVAITVHGNEGWRLITAPTQPLSFSNFLEPVRTQGIPGSNEPFADSPSILDWNGSEDFFRAPNAMSDPMEAGKGYFIYLFEDDNPSTTGVQGGFPKHLTAVGEEADPTVSIEISAIDHNENKRIDDNEGWNLLGNPFSKSISVNELKSLFRTAQDSLNEHIYVWNPGKGNGNGGFEALEDGDNLEPHQAFFLKYMGSEELNTVVKLNRNELASDEKSSPYESSLEQTSSFSMQLSSGSQYDEYTLHFSDKGSLLPHTHDAFKLFSINPQSLHLYGLKNQAKIQSNSLPGELPSTVEIPIGHQHYKNEELIFSWENIEKLPHEWTMVLRDTEQDIETDLRTNKEYRFFHKLENRNQKTEASVKRPQVIRKKNKKASESERFVLVISPRPGDIAVNDEPESIKLNPNYPNPFNPETTISFELTEETEVTLSVWNMIGQKIATLVDDLVEPGTHEARWNASQMPSGMYIARLEVGNEVFTRKMTLIK